MRVRACMSARVRACMRLCEGNERPKGRTTRLSAAEARRQRTLDCRLSRRASYTPASRSSPRASCLPPARQKALTIDGRCPAAAASAADANVHCADALMRTATPSGNRRRINKPAVRAATTGSAWRLSGARHYWLPTPLAWQRIVLFATSVRASPVSEQMWHRRQGLSTLPSARRVRESVEAECSIPYSSLHRRERDCRWRALHCAAATACALWRRQLPQPIVHTWRRRREGAHGRTHTARRGCR